MAKDQPIDEIITQGAIDAIGVGLVGALKKSLKELQANIKTAKSLGDALSTVKTFSDYNKAAQNASLAQEKVAKAASQTKLAEERLASFREQESARQEARDRAALNRSNAKANAIDNEKRKIQEASRAYNLLSSQLELMRKNAKDLAVQFGVNSREFKNAAKEANTLDKELKKIDKSLGQSQRNVGNYPKGLDGVANSLKGLVATYISLNSVQETFNQSLQSDAVKTSLSFTFQSTDLAEAKLKELAKTADLLGLNYNALTSSYRSFTGAVIASNFNLIEGERIFNAVAGASGRLKLSADQTEGALRAIQQMISKGNVQAEELRGQLGERLPGAFAIAARAMGVTEMQLNDLLKKGEVLAADLLPKLATELEKTFDTKTEEKITGLSGAWERLKNSFSTTVAENTNISSFFENIITGAEGALSAIGRLINSTSYLEFSARINKGDSAGDAVRGVRDYNSSGNRALSKASKVNLNDGKQVGITFQEVKLAYEGATRALKLWDENAKKFDSTPTLKKEAEELRVTVNKLGNEYLTLQKNLPKLVIPGKPAKPKSKSELNAEATLARKNAAAEIELEIQGLEAIAAAYKENVDAENLSTEARIIELERYQEVRQNLLKLETDKEKAGKKLTAKEILAIDEEYNSKRTAIERDGVKILNTIIKDGLDENSRIRAEQQQIELNNLYKKRDEELALLDALNRDGALTEEGYEEARIDILNRYAQEEINIQIRIAEETLAIRKAAGGDVSSQEAQLSTLKLRYLDIEADARQKAADKEKSDREKNFADRKNVIEKEKELARELFNFTTVLANSAFTAQQNRIQEEINSLEKRTALQIEQVNESTLSEEDKANRIAIINARATAQEELLQQKQRNIRIKQAKADKAAAIAGVILNIALAEAKTLGQVGILGLPLLPIIAALGAVQIATILATPIPKFEKGGTMGHDGLMITGEKGTEMRINPDGSTELTPDRANLSYAKKGTKILNHAETMKILAKPDAVGAVAGKAWDVSAIVESNRETASLIKKAVDGIRMPTTIITKSGWNNQQVKANKFNKYIKNNFS